MIVEQVEDRLVIRSPSSAVVGPLVLLGLGGYAIYRGAVALAADSDYVALLPVGVLLAFGAFLVRRSASRPIVLDKALNSLEGSDAGLSSVQSVVVTKTTSREGDSYFVELVLPTGTYRLRRWSWGDESLPHDPDVVAKKVGEFLNVPVKTYMPFYASYSLAEGFHLTPDQAAAAERAGVKVDPAAIK